MVKWESIAVFHAAGDGLDPEGLLARHPVPHATTYRKGDAGAFGRTHTISGFKVDLGAFQSKAALEQGLLAHLREHSGLYRDVRNDGGRSSLGIGLSVFSKEPRTVTFPLRSWLRSLTSGSPYISLVIRVRTKSMTRPPNDALQLTSGGPLSLLRAPSLMRRSQLNAVLGGHDPPQRCGITRWRGVELEAR